MATSVFNVLADRMTVLIYADAKFYRSKMSNKNTYHFFLFKKSKQKHTHTYAHLTGAVIQAIIFLTALNRIRSLITCTEYSQKVSNVIKTFLFSNFKPATTLPSK